MSGHEAHGHGKKIETREPIKKYEKESNITDEYIKDVRIELQSIEKELHDLHEEAHSHTSHHKKEAIEHVIHIKEERKIHLLNEESRYFIESIKMKEEPANIDKEVYKIEKELEYTKDFKEREKLEDKIAKLFEKKREAFLKISKNQENIMDANLTLKLNRARSEYTKEFKKHHKGIKTQKRIDNLKISITNIGIKVKNKLNSIKPSSWDWTRDDFKGTEEKKLLKKKDPSEYETPEFRAKKKDYDDARIALANRMYERKEKELRYVGAKTREEAAKSVKEGMLNEIEQSGMIMSKEDKENWEKRFKEKVDAGELDEEIDRIRLESGQLDPAEQINRLKQYKAKEILQKTFFDEKKRVHEESGVPERGQILRLWHWYGKQPRWKKIALSTALFTAGGATGAIPFAAGMIAKYGIISYAGMRFGTSALIGGAVANAVKGIDTMNYKNDEDFKKEQERKRKESEDKFINGEINQKEHEEKLLVLNQENNENLKKRMRVKAAVGVLLGAGVGAGAYHLIGGIMPDGKDNITLPAEKGIHITKEPEPMISSEVAHAKPEATIQVNPESAQKYIQNRIPHRDPAGPEIDMNPNRDILERGGPAITSDHTPAITSDITPHTTADGIGPASQNAPDQSATIEKPKYNMGDYKPEDRNAPQYNKETGELTTKSTETPKIEDTDPNAGKQFSPETNEPINPTENTSNSGLEQNSPAGNEQVTTPTGPKMDYYETQKIQNEQLQDIKKQLGEKEYNKLIEDLESKKIPYKSDTAKLRTIAIGEDSNENFAKTLSRNNANSKLLEQTGQKQASLGESQIIDSRTYTLENGEYRKILVIETEKVNGQDIENLFKKSEPNTRVDAPDPNAGKQFSPETNEPIEPKNLEQVSDETKIKLIEQKQTYQINKNLDSFKETSNLSETKISKLLKPSDSNHVVVVVEGSGSDQASAANNLNQVMNRRSMEVGATYDLKNYDTTYNPETKVYTSEGSGHFGSNDLLKKGELLHEEMVKMENGEYKYFKVIEIEKPNPIESTPDMNGEIKIEENSTPKDSVQENPETGNNMDTELKKEDGAIRTAEETKTQTTNNSYELKKPDPERFNKNLLDLEDKIRSGERQNTLTSDKGQIENYRQLKKLMSPSDSNHEVVVIKATAPTPNIANLILDKEQVNYSEGVKELNKIYYENQDGTYSVYKILEVKKSALIDNVPSQENIQTNTPKIESGATPIESNSQNIEGNGQTAAEYTKSLISQSASKAENLRSSMGLSEGEMKTMLTPSDANHTRIVIEKTSPKIETAQKMINYDIRNIKAVSEDFKKVIDQKVYQDSNGYHVYEVIEIKK